MVQNVGAKHRFYLTNSQKNQTKTKRIKEKYSCLAKVVEIYTFD